MIYERYSDFIQRVRFSLSHQYNIPSMKKQSYIFNVYLQIITMYLPEELKINSHFDRNSGSSRQRIEGNDRRGCTDENLR